MDTARQRFWVRRIFARKCAFYDHLLLQQLYYRPVHRRMLRGRVALRFSAAPHSFEAPGGRGPRGHLRAGAA